MTMEMSLLQISFKTKLKAIFSILTVRSKVCVFMGLWSIIPRKSMVPVMCMPEMGK